MNMGRVYFPRFPRWFHDARDQLLKFPHSGFDDFVDALSLIGLGLMKQIPARGQPKDAGGSPERVHVRLGERKTRSALNVKRAPQWMAGDAWSSRSDHGGGAGAVRHAAGRLGQDLLSARRIRSEDAGARPARPDAATQGAGQSLESAEVKHAKKHWKPAFERMKEDQDFCLGKQWSKNPKEKRYVANITLREVTQRVSFLYARNPKAVAKRREMILNTVWDGTEQSLQAIQEAGAMAMQSGALQGMSVGPGAPDPNMGPSMPPGGPTPPGAAPGAAPGPPGAPPGPPGMAPPPGAPPGMPPGLGGGPPGANPAIQPMMQQGMAIIADASQVKQQTELLDKIAKTLELLYAYQVGQQLHPFKQLLKMTVRRALTVGVAYVKLGLRARDAETPRRHRQAQRHQRTSRNA